MRIRKRQVPFPLSSLSPIPLSDLHLNRSPVVQQHNHELRQPKGSYPVENLSLEDDGKSTHMHLQPSDQPNRPLSPIGNWVCSDAGGSHEDEKKKKKHRLELMMQREEVEEEEEDKGRREDQEKSNDTRKGSILGAESGTEVLPLSSSSPQVVGMWCEGEKAFPLKKRRGSFERRVNMSNKKCVQQNDNDHEQEDSNNSAKKKVRGGALMEGSRCSRVNGRGWRCCQQTLVGYSLCEHHLGKGRLRSMTSVRSRAMAAATAPKKDVLEKQPEDDHMVLNDDDDHDNDEDEKKPLMITKKRMKIGMVKARSLSSLLGQTNNTVAVSDNYKYNNV